jgi:hypothetical protein
MPRAGLEPTAPMFEQAVKVQALDRAATVIIGLCLISISKIVRSIKCLIILDSVCSNYFSVIKIVQATCQVKFEMCAETHVAAKVFTQISRC